MRLSLRTRLALTHVGVALLAIALVAAIVSVAGSRRFSSYAGAAQQRAAAAVVTALTSSYKGGWDTQSVQAAIKLAGLNGMRLAVFDKSGNALFATGGIHVPGMHGMMGGGQGRGAMAGWTTQTAPIVVAGARVATAALYLPGARSQPGNSAYLRDLGLYLALAGVAAGLVSLGVALWASRRITRPVEQLMKAADAIAHGRRGVSVGAEGGGEVAALADSFNLMSASLARQEQWRKTMTADLAHELRTPLATIQARVEALEDGVLPPTADNLRVVGREVERLGRLLGSLRRLDEVDEAAHHIEPVPVDLRRLVEDAAEATRESLAMKRIALEVDAEPAWVRGDPDRLRQILANLLDNARKFTPEDGHVTVSLRRDDDWEPRAAAWARLTVADDGPGIPTEELPHVFERFFRSRRVEATEGAGLGLAITRSLVEAHGGDISVASSPAGTAFTVRLPATAA